MRDWHIRGRFLRRAAIALVCLLPVHAVALPDAEWLSDISLLAHSVRDQSAVLRLPDGERRLLTSGQTVAGIYELRLLKVLNHRIELVATHPGVRDRKIKLWFTPGADGAQIVSSAQDESEAPPAMAPLIPSQIPGSSDGKR